MRCWPRQCAHEENREEREGTERNESDEEYVSPITRAERTFSPCEFEHNGSALFGGNKRDTEPQQRHTPRRSSLDDFHFHINEILSSFPPVCASPVHVNRPSRASTKCYARVRASTSRAQLLRAKTSDDFVRFSLFSAVVVFSRRLLRASHARSVCHLLLNCFIDEIQPERIKRQSNRTKNSSV